MKNLLWKRFFKRILKLQFWTHKNSLLPSRTVSIFSRSFLVRIQRLWNLSRQHYNAFPSWETENDHDVDETEEGLFCWEKCTSLISEARIVISENWRKRLLGCTWRHHFLRGTKVIIFVRHERGRIFIWETTFQLKNMLRLKQAHFKFQSYGGAWP